MVSDFRGGDVELSPTVISILDPIAASTMKLLKFSAAPSRGAAGADAAAEEVAAAAELQPLSRWALGNGQGGAECNDRFIVTLRSTQEHAYGTCSVATLELCDASWIRKLAN